MQKNEIVALSTVAIATIVNATIVIATVESATIINNNRKTLAMLTIGSNYNTTKNKIQA